MGELSTDQGFYQLSVTSTYFSKKYQLFSFILQIYIRLKLSVECAHLKNAATAFLLKPNPYVELYVDNAHVRKTEVVKCTYQPKWNEEFTMYVFYMAY